MNLGDDRLCCIHCLAPLFCMQFSTAQLPCLNIRGRDLWAFAGDQRDVPRAGKRRIGQCQAWAAVQVAVRELALGADVPAHGIPLDFTELFRHG